MSFLTFCLAAMIVLTSVVPLRKIDESGQGEDRRGGVADVGARSVPVDRKKAAKPA